MRSKFLPYFANLSIFLIPVLYGGYYTATKFALIDIPIFWINVLRLLIAFIVLSPFALKLRHISRRLLLENFLIALVFFIGIISQASALKVSTAGDIGFLAALFIFFTPLLKKVLFKDKISWWFSIPIVVSLFGYVIMFSNNADFELRIGIGEILGIIGALAIAFHMVLTERFIKDNDPILFTQLQILIALLFSVAFALIFDPVLNFATISWLSWGSILYLAIFATVCTFLLQNWGQKFVPALSASLIIALEPIFAALIGAIFNEEEITINIIIGGLCIFLASVGAILIQNRKQRGFLIEDRKRKNCR